MPVQTGIYGYSLGLFISLVEGRHRTGHTGFWPPYESSFSLFPLQNNSNVGIFTSINGPGFTGEFPDQLSQEDVHLLILEILEGSLKDLEQVSLKMNRLKQREAQSMMSIKYQRELEAQDQKRSSRWSVLRHKGSRKQVYRQEELVGLYGSAEPGEINIEENGSNDGTLGIRYGNWGIGTLTPSSTEINTYDVEWSTTINYDFYAFRRFFPLPVFKVYFGAPDQLDFLQDRRLALTFRRDATLDTFPEIPWHPESCGPSTPPRR